IIVGGGNVAIDSARSALRLGATEVTILYRRSRVEMPASSGEIGEAEEEGIRFHFLAAPVKILGQDNKVIAIECIKMQLAEPDASGRRRPLPVKGSEFKLEADLVIPAIGQSPDLAGLEENLNKTNWETIEVDPLTLETSTTGVFAGGDAVSGPATVVDALAAGHEAAISIERYIQHKNLKQGRKPKEKAVSTLPRRRFEKQKRVKIPLLSLKERRDNFREVEFNLSEDEAVREAVRCLDCGICCECFECEKVCEPGAISHDMKDEYVKINTGAVVLTPGVKLFDANIKKEYGYDRYDNVITSIQFERILSSSGPTKGEILRPFGGQAPRKIAFIQCVGSRDLSLGNEFCSSVCCMHSIKQAIISKEHDSKILPTIFFIDIRSFGKDFERYYENAKKDYNVEFIRCLISKIYEQPKSKNLVVKYLNQINKIEEAEFDMVVLAVGLTDTCELKPLAEKLNVDLDKHGFAALKRYSPGLTSREGIYAAGTFLEPKDIPETVAEGSSAAALVSSLLKSSRGTVTKKKEYPPERDISDEDIRIGVFVCRCGRNIASVVDVPEVVKYASKIEGVAYASEFLYSCSKDALDILKEKILEHNLNRVVVASCTPRTHEELFQDTVREAGLNRHLFEMTSLREQVSWVHKNYPKEATQKSKEMVEMIVAKVRRKRALGQELSDVVPKSLVVGGGASGLQAALSVAQQGYEVFLVEKEDSLGGHLKELFDNLGREDPQVFLNSLLEKVQAHEKINVMFSSEIKSCSGYMGNYTSIIKNKDGEKEINHGVVILATGAKSYEPSPGEFGYQESQNIITQIRLEKMLFEGFGKDLAAKTFLMIQCVGSRDDEHPYCSRVCCAHAVKNAIKLKKLNSEHKVIILYRDIRTYGFLEEYYLAAREAGVVFLRFDEISKPRVKINNNIITVTHTDSVLREDIVLEPDFLILSTGIVSQGSEEVSKIFKVPLNTDNFFMEAHAKIRPLDFTTEGIFFCGLAHSPRFLSESLTQAQGASIRAVTVLSKDKIEAKAIIAEVNERLCKGCALCISACPFEARELDEETKIAKVIGVLCQGCGACAVACPSGATKHKGFSKKQIMDMVDKAS
ncbi:MAG: FAD-dependent oxidoreductase, partial [Omnitrophica bacterium]|nr:FAD-dependent oxidoreductase [Candidatus Omnitrophota bacterium]